MRIYVPITWQDLAASEISARPVFTAAELTEEFDDAETAELYAQQRASDLAVAVLRAPRRVILAADVAHVGEPVGEDPARYLLDAPLRWDSVVAILVDEAGVAEILRAATDPSDANLEAAAAVPLLWYDVTERDALLQQTS